MDTIDDIPIEKKIAMANYAKKLRLQFPKMKPERISRKVAEYFHIKLIAQATYTPPAVPINPPEK